jgi:hypothetical protein
MTNDHFMDEAIITFSSEIAIFSALGLTPPFSVA